MSAWDQPVERTTQGNFKKNKWYSWATGYNFMRILGEPHFVATHRINGWEVKCLGDDCPVCQDNARLWTEFGREAPKHDGFLQTSRKAYFNVIDRTVGKICPNTECGVEVKKVRGAFPTACPKCSTMLVSVEPQKLNIIRIVGVSANPNTVDKKTGEVTRYGAFNKIVNVRSQILDENGDPRSFDTYDFCFNSVGEGMERRSEPEVPETLNIEPVEYNVEDLFDLSRCYTTLTADEIQQARRGVQFRDIFAARKTAVSEEQLPWNNEVSEEAKAVAKANVDSLFEE